MKEFQTNKQKTDSEGMNLKDHFIRLFEKNNRTGNLLISAASWKRELENRKGVKVTT